MTRLPTSADVEPTRRIVRVYDKVAERYRNMTAVDAREFILTGDGTLNGPDEENESSDNPGEDAADRQPEDYAQYSLEQLRAFCDSASIPTVGKTAQALQAALAAVNFQPPQD